MTMWGVMKMTNAIQNFAELAVRSSALSEDSDTASSFAGGFESVLNVKTDDEVREALQMAVVVQLMVPSELSGVLFTANPITGSRIAGAVIDVNISVMLQYGENPDADFSKLLDESLSQLEVGLPL
jgi:phosphoenolpyruvate synthase/pyruvate phosphate dikinase